MLWNPAVKAPVAARYMWIDYAEVILLWAYGLPGHHFGQVYRKFRNLIKKIEKRLTVWYNCPIWQDVFA